MWKGGPLPDRPNPTMSISKSQARLFTGIYSIIGKSGLLETSFGRRLFVSSYNLYKRYLEDPFHRLVSKHPELFRAGHVLDIGANIGYTSMVFAQAIEQGYHVYSFEPEEFNFSLLVRCAQSRQMKHRIVPVQSAVGAEDGTVGLWCNPRHPGDHRVLTNHFRKTGVPSNEVFVPITKIDTFVARNGSLSPISFIKVDVQGYEFPVCRGMEQTLLENPNAVLALEYAPEAMSELGFEPEAMLRWLQERGFAVYSLSRNGKLKSGVPSNLDKACYMDLLFSRGPIMTY
jgi:FkbM family methyltransferase